MKRTGLLLTALALGTVAVPAGAQVGGYDGVMFVEAIRKEDTAKALELLKAKPQLVNARDGEGDTALIVAIRERDEAWTAHLLKEGADPNLPSSRSGDTPLISAARAGFEDAIGWLLGLRAKVDATNRMGETPLIAAVQARQTDVVKRLLEAGANPDKTDSAQGYSARDYAKRDARSRDILALIEGSKTKPAKEAQSVDDFRLDKKN